MCFFFCFNQKKFLLFFFLFSYMSSSFQIVIQSGLLKHGLCSVQDESAGHFILTFIGHESDYVLH